MSHNRDSATTTPSSPGSGRASLSADGRYIAYQSTAVDLVPHQTDPPAPPTSSSTTGPPAPRSSPATSAPRSPPPPTALDISRISADGGVVAFGSYATDLAEGQVDPNGFQISSSSTASRPRSRPSPQPAPDLPAVTPLGPSSSADLSADGRFVVFASPSAGLVPGQVDTPYRVDDLRRDAGDLGRLPARPDDGQDHPAEPVEGLAADRRRAVSFRRSAPTATSPPSRRPDAEQPGPEPVHRLRPGGGRADPRQPRPGSPAQPDGVLYGRPALSADGRYIAYTCDECHLVPGQQSGRRSAARPRHLPLRPRHRHQHPGEPRERPPRDDRRPRLAGAADQRRRPLRRLHQRGHQPRRRPDRPCTARGTSSSSTAPPAPSPW